MFELLSCSIILSIIYCNILLVVGFYIYYLLWVVKPPMLVCGNGNICKLIENIEMINENFWPTPWCLESRAQTILASILRGNMIPDINYRREILTLKDGGEVALDWVDNHCTNLSPIVIILPGLTGASQAEYIKCLVTGGREIGIRCVIFNNRGLGGISLKTPRTYCAANSDDFAEVLNHVSQLNPDVQIGATGISMGGLILGNYLAQEREAAVNKLQAAFLVSVPWNVFEGTKSIESGLNRLLNRYLAKALKKSFKNMHNKVEDLLEEDLTEAFKSNTLREFDSAFTAKHFGYKDVNEYYANATLHKKLHSIHVPLLCLTAADDPFQPFDVIPLKEAKESKSIAFLITSHGGHIGFLEGLFPTKQEQYISKLFKQYFQAVFFKNHT
ncbi:phospholipase ABHD3 isoform X1 [Microplitis mediator]|uniref:phospholipase ABHD3 isoform X1 n=2 Tax=Microplitis mediator TaxID=375433 RepID=UPI00255755C2|nr:phospholipase ABHD3 isoform X1 [Microplitis mediator]